MKIASAEQGAGRYVLGFEYPRVPSGLKIDTDDPGGATRNVKKAATFFGAALGELVRNGLLITPTFWPRVRLAKVFTNLPLIADKPVEFGVWDFCIQCEKCARKCPSQSIMYGKPTTKPVNIANREGLFRWPVNAETCLAFWTANGTDCSNCIRTCPFNKPAGRLHDAARWGIKNFPFLNPFFLWGDDLFDYGSRGKADNFWTD